MGHSLYQWTEEEKVQVWFVGGYIENRYTVVPNSIKYTIQTYFFLKESGEKKSFQWLEFQVVYLVSYFMA